MLTGVAERITKVPNFAGFGEGEERFLFYDF
jgi:hypothetical protein